MSMAASHPEQPLLSFPSTPAGLHDRSLSIVVIGRNEGQRLKRCLESVARVRSGDPSIELIYIDSASTDGSPELAAGFGADVMVLEDEHPTAALGRNAGWRRARSAYVLFLDGDTVVDPDFPAIALRAISPDASVAAVWGNLRELYPQNSIYNRVLDLDWVYPPGDSEFCGGIALMRRKALEEAGGFDAMLIAGEEPELCRRLRAQGYRILHLDCPMAGHDLAMTRWGQYWTRATRAGHAYAEIARRFRSSADPMWVAESRANLIRGGFWIASLVLVLAALVRTPLPLALWIAAFLFLALRSAWKARWKAPGKPALLFAYGVHSQLQQIPIFVGQIKHYFDRKMGKRRGLIDYREGSGA
jgi:glycosyltransferase involved in cell wall biosynthesis